MGGSAAEGPTPAEAGPTPGGLRASDADRDKVASRLTDEFVAGRLSHDTFLHRMDAAFQARQRGKLSPLLDGLPSRPEPVSPLRAGGRSVAGWFRGARTRVAGSAARRIPFVGGLVGMGADGYATWRVGRYADRELLPLSRR